MNRTVPILGVSCVGITVALIALNLWAAESGRGVEGWGGSSAMTLVVATGALTLGGQIILTSLVRQDKTMPSCVRAAPEFAAHQIVALAAMIAMTVLGAIGWFGEDLGDTAQERMLRVSPLGRSLGQMSLGFLVAWDIPCALFLVPGSGMDMKIHHVMMAGVGYVASSSLPSQYFTFFLGFGEVSSIISVAGQETLHPKRFFALTEAYPFIAAYNEVMRALFALFFLATRGLYFTYIIGAQVLPDLAELAATGTGDITVTRVVQAFCVAFTALQLYWSWLIAGHVIKALTGADQNSKKDA